MKSDTWIIRNQNQLKMELLKLARDCKPKPKKGTTLGRALELFTTADLKEDSDREKLSLILFALLDSAVGMPEPIKKELYEEVSDCWKQADKKVMSMCLFNVLKILGYIKEV